MVGASKDPLSGVFEGLDMLAAIATQELQSNADDKRNKIIFDLFKYLP